MDKIPVYYNGNYQKDADKWEADVYVRDAMEFALSREVERRADHMMYAVKCYDSNYKLRLVLCYNGIALDDENFNRISMSKLKDVVVYSIDKDKLDAGYYSEALKRLGFS